MTQKKFKAIFSSKIHKVSNIELDKYVSAAGLEKLKPIMPNNVNLGENPDLIGVCLNAAVAGYSNLNGDCITNKAALAVSKNFVWKFVDLEHHRDHIIGVICNYGFSEFGTNKLLTEAELQDYKKPFNISLAILLYKALLSNNFIKELEESADETSPNYGKLSASWEMYFDAFKIAKGSRDVNQAEIIEKDSEELYKYLQCYGGSGRKDGEFIYRVIEEDNLIPGGIGIVENPAAEVKALAIVTANELNNLPNNEEISVISSKQEIIMSTPIEKIDKVEQITDENLKLMKASNIVTFISDEIKKASEQYVAEKNATENKLREMEAKSQETLQNFENAQKQVNELTQKLSKLEAQIAEVQKTEVFNQRMAYFDSEYELSTDERQVIASEIKDLDEVGFTNYSKKIEVLLKDKSKKAIEAKKLTIATQVSVASVVAPVEPNVQTVVDNAVSTATQEPATIPNTLSPVQTLQEKFAKAFSIENCTKKSK